MADALSCICKTAILITISMLLTLILKTFEQYCEYRKTPNGVILAPIKIGRCLVVFCDEINLPAMDKYGTQRVISFLRQLVESGGYYRHSDMAWVKLERIQFVGACNPPTDPGHVPLSHRFLRYAPLVVVDYPGELSLKQILASRESSETPMATEAFRYVKIADYIVLIKSLLRPFGHKKSQISREFFVGSSFKVK